MECGGERYLMILEMMEPAFEAWLYSKRLSRSAVDLISDIHQVIIGACRVLQDHYLPSTPHRLTSLKQRRTSRCIASVACIEQPHKQTTLMHIQSSRNAGRGFAEFCCTMACARSDQDRGDRIRSDSIVDHFTQLDPVSPWRAVCAILNNE